MCVDAVFGAIGRVWSVIGGGVALLCEAAAAVAKGPARGVGAAERAGADRAGVPSRPGPAPSEVIALAHRPDAIEVAAAPTEPSEEGGEDGRPIVLPTGDLVVRRPEPEAETGEDDGGSMRPALETWIDRARRSRYERGERS